MYENILNDFIQNVERR